MGKRYDAIALRHGANNYLTTNMKIILYMAISANGMIAKNDDNTSWISETEWNSYSAAVQKAGCLVVGRRTYEILTKQPEFSELKDVTLVAVSKTNLETIAPNHFVTESPQQALEKLSDFETVIIAGGGILNAEFVQQNLVDEIFLDIEPIILGKGIKLFNGDEFEKNLKLLDTTKISANEIQLHYKVVK